MLFEFSVLMSIYHRDDPVFLKQALDSLVYQSLPANEIIVVFDGDIGPSLESIVSSYSQVLPIKALKLAENVGLGNALNLGLNEVSHDWVFRMDSDDICRVDRFEIQSELIKNNPDVDVTGGWIDEFESEVGDQKRIRKVPLSNLDIYSSIGKFSPFNHVTVAFKKNAVLEVGGYKGGKNFPEDYYLWLRMAASHSKFLNTNKVLVDVRTGSGMISRRGGLDYYKNEMKIARYAQSIGVISKSRLLLIGVLKFILRLSPVFIRQLIYSLHRKLS
ncbi:glycosyltransferase [Vibrio vulnificus]|uniref:glycosyltransferase n=1 Tax=Vibrio vulnificus TaxID=672 RepID=UPI001CDCEA25|nr:glycosyltransferase [Vibrio vulnificus]MCA3963747.1 glycosyltransferase [Vibrio vulnificus]